MKFYLISFFLFSTNLFAHREVTSRTNVNGYSGSSQNSYGGYGYYYGSRSDIKSEAAAYDLGDFQCQEFQPSSSDDIISDPGNCPTGKISALYDSSVEVSRRVKIQATFDKLRDKALEYFALNLESATSGSSNPFSVRDLFTENTGGFCPREIPQSDESKSSSVDFMSSGEKIELNTPEPSQNCFCKLSPGSNMTNYRDGKRTAINEKIAKQRLINQGMESLSMITAVLERERSITVLGVRPKRPSAERRHDEMPFFKRDVTQYRFYRDLGADTDDGDIDNDADLNCRKHGRSFRENSDRSIDERTRSNYCQAWGADLYRLETNFPHLYRRPDRARFPFAYEPNAEEADAIFDYQLSVKRNGKYKAVFKPGLLSGAKEVYELMGGSWSDLMTSIVYGRSDGIEKFKTTYERALGVMKNPSLLRKLGSEGQELRKAFQKVEAASKEIKRKFSFQIRKIALPRLCKTKDEKVLMTWLFKAYPNIIRQLMIDLPPDERLIMREIFCRNGFGESLAHADQCSGVSGGPLPGPNPVKVRRKFGASLMLGADNYLEIAQSTPNSPRVVKMKVNLIPGPNMSTPQVMQRFASKMKRDANKYFNCQFGNPPPSYTDPDNNTFNCPAGPNMNKPPGLKLELDVVVQPKGAKPVEPFFYVHDCFRSELVSGSNGIKYASDCKKVNEYSLRRCIKSLTSARANPRLTKSQAKNQCLAAYPLRSPNNNRENARNITTFSDIGTLRHELFHQMGANRDEYEDPNLPFNPLGELDSLMRWSSQPNSRLYPRHVRKMLSPLKCVKRRLR